jgi:hypothetical protein
MLVQTRSSINSIVALGIAVILNSYFGYSVYAEEAANIPKISV